MANSNGLFKRGSSYYLRVVLPKTHQLINAYKSLKVIASLGACSYREGLTAAAIKRAQGDSFRAWLQEHERNTASKTAYGRFT
jgi:hypothetical protein